MIEICMLSSFSCICRVVYKSQQLAKFAGFSDRFCQLLSLLHKWRYAEETMFIRSHNRLLFTKLQLLKNLKKTLICHSLEFNSYSYSNIYTFCNIYTEEGKPFYWNTSAKSELPPVVLILKGPWDSSSKELGFVLLLKNVVLDLSARNYLLHRQNFAMVC